MMLRNTWGGVGRNSILELAHMVDAGWSVIAGSRSRYTVNTEAVRS